MPKTEVAGYHSITSSARSVSDTGLYAVTKNGDKKFWQPVGALWAHADGKGFNLRIDYLPLNEAQLVVREKGDEQAEGNGGAQ